MNMLRNHLGMTHIMGQPSHGDFAILCVMCDPCDQWSKEFRAG